MLPLALCLIAHAGTRPAATPGWLLDTWTSEDGLPLDHATGVAMGPDGAIRIATFDGLVRFDGARFIPYSQEELQGLRTSRVAGLEVHPDDGALWVLSDNSRAVARELDGELRVWDHELDFPAAPGMLSVDEGGLWLSTDAGLYSVGERPERWREALIDGVIVGTVLAPDGTRWVASAGGTVWRIPASGRPEALGADHGVPELIYLLVAGPQGEPVLTAPGHAPLRWDGERFSTAEHESWRLLGRTRGLTERVLPLGRGWGLSTEGIFFGDVLVEPWTGLLRDAAVMPDGTLWLATASAGVMRVRPAEVQVLRADELDAQVDALQVDAQGRLWLRGWSGWWTLGPEGPEHLLPEDPQLDSVRADYLVDIAGRKGLIGNAGIAWLSGDGATAGEHDPTLGLVYATYMDPDGVLFVGEDRRLFALQAGAWSEELDAEGRSIPQVRDIEAHPAGGLLLATIGGGLLHLPADGALTRYIDPNGLNTDNIREVRLDGGWLWVASEDLGLCVVPVTNPAAAWRCLGPAEGLPATGAHLSVSDGQGRIWVSTNRGLGVAAEEVLRGFAVGEQEALPFLHLGTQAGMASAEANGGNDLCAARTPDGRLWFASQKGAVGVDPATFRLPEAPELQALQARVGGERLAQEGARLPAQHPPLELSWHVGESLWTEQVRYRWRLGDGPWSPARLEPSATLASLPPGPFTVEVQAGLAGGWGPVASWSGTRAPSLSERPAFPIGLAALGGLSILGWAWVRERRRQADEQELEAQVRARTAQLAESNAALASRTQELSDSNTTLVAQANKLATQAEQLRQLDELRARMIVNLHHELRTPVSLVLGPLDALRGAQGLSGAEKEALDMASRSAESLETLLGQLFDIARLEACELPLRAAYVDLGALARRVAARLEPFARERGVALVVREAPALPAWCDPELMDKALGNLVHNAIKFSPTDGRVELAARRDEDWLRLEVQDDGPGVPEADQERIFERLYQVDRSDSRRRGGAGVGLALAKEVVELHGGWVAVTSRPEGGSCFTISLQADEAPRSTEEIGLAAPSPALTPALPAVESPAGAPRLLIVDDHPDMRAFLHGQLAKDYEVRVAADGEEALRSARERPPLVVISDVMMPGMTGFELARRLKDDPSLGSPRVLLLSAKTAVEDRVAGLEVAEDYLTKPFRIAELRARVRRLLYAPAAYREPHGPASPTSPEPPEAEPPEAEPPMAEADRALLKRVEATALQHLHEPDFRVSTLASAVAMSPRNFRRELRRLTERSPSEWLLELRLERARELLQAGAFHTVGEVAAAVGLSRSYFSRAYTGWAEHPPGDDLLGG